ncbi:MAG: MurR/RpiR family transcriptional regulator [Bacillota bacterium]|jgi:DNA-binding MurR/RpiR family transcriptional regulator
MSQSQHDDGLAEAILPRSGCLALIRRMFNSLRPAEKKVASYILDNGGQVVYQSITELASATGTSDATIIRFANALGFSGYQELKIALARELVSPDRNIHEDIDPRDSLQVAVNKAFQANVQAVSDTLNVLDIESLQRAIDAVVGANHVYLYGVGTSSLSAQDAYYKLLRVGIHANFYADAHMQAISTAMIGEDDVVIGFSHSGSTRDVVDVLSLARERGACIVCVTNRVRSPMAKLADIVLRTASEETPFGSGGVPSMIAQLSVVDALFVGVSLAMYDRAIDFIERTGETVKNKKY